ncbi:MAG: Crp/Fnr family transcriptional regulator [Bdellovibrionales bacterium]|nr:Crp/Fnr family transcriptional regulator [Bdellovibrionales bacterium]
MSLKKETCDQCETRHNSVLCASPEVSQLIEKIKVKCRYKHGQSIFMEGSEPLGLFTLQSGLVKLEVNSSEGNSHTLRLIGPGGVIGYRSLFAGEAYKANAIAVEDTELCFIPKAELLDIFARHPESSLRFMEFICKDLRQAEEKWMDQIDKGAPERVAEAILFLQDHFKAQQWTRKEIAQWAGTTPETVMRTLAQFEREGLIDQSGRKIIILKRDKIQEKAQY